MAFGYAIAVAKHTATIAERRYIAIDVVALLVKSVVSSHFATCAMTLFATTARRTKVLGNVVPAIIECEDCGCGLCIHCLMRSSRSVPTAE